MECTKEFVMQYMNELCEKMLKTIKEALEHVCKVILRVNILSNSSELVIKRRDIPIIRDRRALPSMLI